MATIKIRKETREERNDVFSFLTTKKQLNENDEIVEVEVPIKENTTFLILQSEKDALQNQIADLQSKIDTIDEMKTMITNYSE